jgi:hypothetical protein
LSSEVSARPAEVALTVAAAKVGVVVEEVRTVLVGTGTGIWVVVATEVTREVVVVVGTAVVVRVVVVVVVVREVVVVVVVGGRTVVVVVVVLLDTGAG